MWLPIFVVLGAGLIFALVLGILAVAFKARPQKTGWAQRAAVQAPPGAPPPEYQPWSAETPYVGEWNAVVIHGGAAMLGLNRTFGTMRLEAGLLSFTPDDTPVPAWSVPCQQLAAGRGSMFALDGGDVRLWGPMGEVRCAVSTEHINRFSANTAKDFRERGHATHFVGLLHAHGAGVLS